MYYQDRLTIITPEGVTLDLSLAGVGARGGAAVIDLIIRLVALFALAFTLDLAGLGFGTPLTLAAFIVLNFLLVFGYDIAFETLNAGRTPGKMVLGIKVMNKGGGPVGFVASAIRNLLRIIDFLPAAYVVGMAAITMNRTNQRLGDMAGSTIVVQQARARTKTSDEASLPAASLDGWDASAVNDDELAAVRSYLARRDELDPWHSSDLAGRLRLRLAPKVAQPPGVVDDVEFLRMVERAKLERR